MACSLLKMLSGFRSGREHLAECAAVGFVRMTRLRHTATTHVGKVRKVNEDRILSLPGQLVWVVSDGMGGHAGGDFASQAVVDSVATMPLRDGPA
jgi:hypothetical protein